MASGLPLTFLASGGHLETRVMVSSKEGSGRSATVVAPTLESELGIAQSLVAVVFKDWPGNVDF